MRPRLVRCECKCGESNHQTVITASRGIMIIAALITHVFTSPTIATQTSVRRFHPSVKKTNSGRGQSHRRTRIHLYHPHVYHYRDPGDVVLSRIRMAQDISRCRHARLGVFMATCQDELMTLILQDSERNHTSRETPNPPPQRPKVPPPPPLPVHKRR